MLLRVSITSYHKFEDNFSYTAHDTHNYITTRENYDQLLIANEGQIFNDGSNIPNDDFGHTPYENFDHLAIARDGRILNYNQLQQYNGRNTANANFDYMAHYN